MYTKHFGLSEKPFSLAPNPDALYRSSGHNTALTYLEYGLRDNIGFILLTGEIGTGKTTLIRYLLATMDIDMEVALIFNTNVTPEDLLQMVLRDLELEPDPGSKSANLDRLHSHLLERQAQGTRCVLVIDEAQNLSREAMEEVRMLSNLSAETGSLLQIILVGQPELRRFIREESLKQLAQRIAISYHLRALGKQETFEYVRYRLDRVGCSNPELFSQEALELLYEHTGGTPRLINLVCDAALLYAYADEAWTVTAETLEQVLEDRRDDWFAEPEEPPASAGGDQPAAKPSGGRLDPEMLFSLLKSQQSQLAVLQSRVSRLEDEVRAAVQTGREQELANLREQIRQEQVKNQRLLFRYGKSRGREADLEKRLQRLESSGEGSEHQDEGGPSPDQGSGSPHSSTPGEQPPAEEARQEQAAAPKPAKQSKVAWLFSRGPRLFGTGVFLLVMLTPSGPASALGLW